MCKCNSAEKEVKDVTNALNPELFFFFFEFSGVQELLLEVATGTEIARILWLIQSLLSAVTNKKY